MMFYSSIGTYKYMYIWWEPKGINYKGIIERLYRVAKGGQTRYRKEEEGSPWKNKTEKQENFFLPEFSKMQNTVLQSKYLIPLLGKQTKSSPYSLATKATTWKKMKFLSCYYIKQLHRRK
uniref:Uncharacterized protein n=1 Tax=Cacopsylla melanoneura TaxID=428564 RepID=A0A8D8ZKJ2_9HEMI